MRFGVAADNIGVTTSTQVLQPWATRPVGKAARLSLAILGMTMATLVLMTAAAVDSGSWAQVLLGVALATTSVRAAILPATPRLVALTAIVVAIPLSLQVL